MSRPRTMPLPDVAELHRRYAYDPATGVFTHKPRAGDDGLVIAHNRRWAGKSAGYLMNTGYWALKIGAVSMLAHRMAWAMHFGSWPEGELDHRDGNKCNNSIDNLRLATREQNMRNRRGKSRTGFKGVQPSRNRKRFVAMINDNGMKYIGTFDTAEEASEAYNRVAFAKFGEFANLGIIPHGKINATINLTARAA